jgi:hypothetical protein
VVAWVAGRLLLLSLWALLVCYPDPGLLREAILHTWRPPIDGAAVRDWARELPDDPRQIEAAVLQRVRYAVPWETDGVPWALPLPARTLATGYGDCQARAVVLASVLAAKGIPYRLRASLDHLWVDYPGKQGNALEDDTVALWTRPVVAPPRGPSAVSVALPPPVSLGPGPLALPRSSFHLPRIDVAESYRLEKAYFWDAAPGSRKVALLLGLVVFYRRRPSR